MPYFFIFSPLPSAEGLAVRADADAPVAAGRCGHRPLRNSIEKTSVGADAYIGPPGLIPHLLLTVSLRSRRVRRLWQSVLLWICTGVLRIPTTSLRTGLGMTGFITRGAVDDRRCSALSPPPDGKIFCPVSFVYRPILFVNLTNIARGHPGKIYAFI